MPALAPGESPPAAALDSFGGASLVAFGAPLLVVVVDGDDDVDGEDELVVVAAAEM